MEHGQNLTQPDLEVFDPVTRPAPVGSQNYLDGLTGVCATYRDL